MPEPGSHKYDIKRARLRDDYESTGVNDQQADEATAEDLHRRFPAPRDPKTGEPAGRRTPGEPGAQGVERDAAGGGLDLRSSTFPDHGIMPLRCSADGDNTSPALEWGEVPAGTREIAVLCEDADAPGGPVVHWLMAGVPPERTGLAEDEVPEQARLARNVVGRRSWDGPQPPVGDPAHRYFFRVWAATAPLDLGDTPSAADLRRALDGRTAARGTLVGLYQR